MEAETLIAVAGAAALIFATGIVLSIGRRKPGRADKLAAAYERAKYARRTGTMGSDRGYIR